jgi:prepilin-type N-terminal cleavage/methylation domain-containing protein
MNTSLTRTSLLRPAGSRGFTLIELLVVIAIIGVLSSVVLASLNTARAKGYDARRFSDLRNVQTAVENYFSDHGAYPITAGTHFYSNCNNAAYTYQSTANNVIPGLVSGGYISSIPVGPQANAASNYDCYAYESTANGSDYKFMDYGSTGVGGKTPSGSLLDPDYGTAAWSVYSSPWAGSNL